MTNTALLRAKIQLSGLRLSYIAEKVGLTYQGLMNKVNNKQEFRASEIQMLYEMLGLTEDERVEIFFAQ